MVREDIRAISPFANVLSISAELSFSYIAKSPGVSAQFEHLFGLGSAYELAHRA